MDEVKQYTQMSSPRTVTTQAEEFTFDACSSEMGQHDHLTQQCCRLQVCVCVYVCVLRKTILKKLVCSSLTVTKHREVRGHCDLKKGPVLSEGHDPDRVI